ncbi:hypothetical protein EDC01DRAFT_673283 [Geopyxis carbonaria]|nr:hypothetical protein EDC01DRAFT_673283 [Geopyxis carbonaria]
MGGETLSVGPTESVSTPVQPRRCPLPIRPPPPRASPNPATTPATTATTTMTAKTVPTTQFSAPRQHPPPSTPRAPKAMLEFTTPVFDRDRHPPFEYHHQPSGRKDVPQDNSTNGYAMSGAQMEEMIVERGMKKARRELEMLKARTDKAETVPGGIWERAVACPEGGGMWECLEPYAGGSRGRKSRSRRHVAIASTLFQGIWWKGIMTWKQWCVVGSRFL